METITNDTKLKDLLEEYSWLKDELVKMNAGFKMLNTPMAKVMLKKATIADMSQKSGMDPETLIKKLTELISKHE